MNLDLCTFIQENKTEIDAYIEFVSRKPMNINDEMRCIWVKHEEWLYNLAESRGVQFKKVR
jgi:hypothetical protein